LLPDVASVTRESALAEGARIRYEDAVMDRAWSVLQRPARTKPQPKFPEPARNKTHWDHLLEEMRWLSGDFVRERKFREKLARRAAYAVQKSDLDLESRVVKRARDEAIAQRKTSRNIGNEVMRFWMKVEKVVRFKAQSAVDAKRQTVMDKHLDFLLGQTERYSSMLATKLTGVPEDDGPEDDGTENGAPAGAVPLALPPAPGAGDGADELGDGEDEYVADDAEMAEEDDEATLEEEMRRAAAEDDDDGDA
jgi:E1A-binding protein p400